MKQSWTTTGFWLVLGLAAGMLISDLTKDEIALAAANSTINQEYCMATGASFAGQNEVVWLLDYAGARLHCITLDQKGNVGSAGYIDVKNEFRIEGEGEAHFMMVTAGYVTQRVDVLFLAETTSGNVLCIAPPSRRVPGPQVIGRLNFKPEQEIQ